jgi:hypothetical protein
MKNNTVLDADNREALTAFIWWSAWSAWFVLRLWIAPRQAVVVPATVETVKQ